jgi:hypothetical protein
VSDITSAVGGVTEGEASSWWPWDHWGNVEFEFSMMHPNGTLKCKQMFKRNPWARNILEVVNIKIAIDPLHQNPSGILHRTTTSIKEHKRSSTANAIQTKRSKLGVSQCLISSHTTGLVTKPAHYWHKNKHADWWNRVEIPEMNPCAYSQLTLNKSAKNTHWR